MTTATSPRRTHTVLWVIGALVLLIAAVLVLGQVKDAEGDPLINNPDALLIQIVATAGLVGAGTLPLLIKAQRDAAEAKEQVSNDHIDEHGNPINMRVEQDVRHDAVIDLMIAKFEDITRHVNTQFDGIREEIRDLRKDDKETRTKLDRHIEDTAPVRPKHLNP